ncbi:MAG TPA: hypothetical protein VFN61_00285 [Acidimicrobiales bacterium]|nr:hypothetical protein [Acidimicrobiales bacterium]
MAEAHIAQPDVTTNEEVREPGKTATGASESVVDGARVRVSWMRFQPRDESGSGEPLAHETAIFLLPGWGYTEAATPTMAVGQAFADASGSVVYAIDTYTERTAAYVAQREAQAAKAFIDTIPAPRRILVGQSQGGWAAMYIAAQMPDVIGLVLVNSMGLETRRLGSFMLSYVKENVDSSILADYPAHSRSATAELQAANWRYIREGLTEIGRQVHLAGGVLPYLERLSAEVKGMIVQNPCAGELTMPIVIVNGARDQLSRPDSIIPMQRPDHRGSPYLPSVKEREAYLRDHLFSKSPYIRMIVARKMGYHGLVAYRPLEVARAALYLLARADRVRAANQRASAAEQG